MNKFSVIASIFILTYFMSPATYALDSRGRLTREKTYIDGASTPTTSVQYSYDVLGRRNAISSGGLIQADHYALQGWSVQRRAELNSAILFDEYMHRDDAFYGTPSHTGAIAEVFWMWNNQPAGTYEYSYDNLGRLTDSRIWMYGQPNSYFSERDISYDLNGNITALKRYGSSSAAASDDLSYAYDGNRISSLTGSLVDFGARMYDPHTGHWTTQDPMAWKYLSLSPYNYCGNNPVNLVDPDGRRIYYSSGASDDFKKAFSKTIEYMNKQGTANNLYLLEISPVVYYIDEAHSINDVHFDIRRRTIYWDYSHLAETDINMWLSPATTLDHEAAHAVLFDLCVRGIVNKKDYFESAKTNSDKNYGTTEERQAVTKYEQSTARKHGEINETQVTRNNHGIRQVNGSVANKSPQEIQKIIHEHNSLL